MVMRVDEVFDGLVRKHPLRLSHCCHRSIVSGRPFDDDDVIFELDEKALRRTIIQKPDAIGDFLRLDPHSRGSFTPASATAALRVAPKLGGC